MKKPKLFFAAAALLSLFTLFGCTRETVGIADSTEAVLIRNVWVVDYYFEDLNMTSDFSAGKLLFSSTGAVAYQKNGVTIGGRWSQSVATSGTESVIVHFETTEPEVARLSQDWQVRSHTDHSIELEKTGGVLFRLRTQ